MGEHLYQLEFDLNFNVRIVTTEIQWTFRWHAVHKPRDRTQGLAEYVLPKDIAERKWPKAGVLTTRPPALLYQLGNKNKCVCVAGVASRLTSVFYSFWPHYID